MAGATHQDVIRLFPGIQDHTALRILKTHAPVEDIEAAALILQNADEGSIEIRRREGDRINRIVAILQASELRPPDESEP